VQCDSRPESGLPSLIRKMLAETSFSSVAVNEEGIELEVWMTK
jgi:hypothetical protein